MKLIHQLVVIVVIILSVVSGLAHVSQAIAKSRIIHFGQFFAGMEFFIIALFLLVLVFEAPRD